MRFYTISPRNASELNKIGEKITCLCHYGLETGEKVSISPTIFLEEEMNQIGIKILNNSKVPYEISNPETHAEIQDKKIISEIEKECNWNLEPICAEIDLNKLNEFLSRLNNFKILKEEILVEKSNQDIADYVKSIFDSYMGRITRDYEENVPLIITDPYLFGTPDNLIDILISIIKAHNIQEIEIYTEYRNEKYFKDKASKAGMKCQVKYNKDFHDRFWIYGECGFVLGTSVNGIAKKITRIDLLDSNEIKMIKQEIENINKAGAI